MKPSPLPFQAEAVIITAKPDNRLRNGYPVLRRLYRRTFAVSDIIAAERRSVDIDQHSASVSSAFLKPIFTDHHSSDFDLFGGFSHDSKTPEKSQSHHRARRRKITQIDFPDKLNRRRLQSAAVFGFSVRAFFR